MKSRLNFSFRRIGTSFFFISQVAYQMTLSWPLSREHHHWSCELVTLGGGEEVFLGQQGNPSTTGFLGYFLSPTGCREAILKSEISSEYGGSPLLYGVQAVAFWSIFPEGFELRVDFTSGLTPGRMSGFHARYCTSGILYTPGK